MEKRTFRAVFFDLDGTLLPMDLEVFTKTYLKLLAGRFALLEDDPLLPEYLEATIQKLRRAAAGLSCASSQEAGPRLEQLKAVLDGMEQEYRRLQNADRR